MKHSVFITERENLDVLAVRAQRRWRALLDLDHGRERAELRAAGVIEHRIDALYPRPSLESVVPKLLPLLRQDAEVELPILSDLWRELSTVWRRRLIDAHSRFADTDAGRQLALHFSPGIPPGALGPAATKLHELYWYMQHESELNLKAKVHRPLIELLDAIVPQLIDHAAVKNTSL